MIEAGQGQLGEVGEIAVPGGGRLLQLGLRLSGLPHFLIGDAGKVVCLGAFGEPSILLSHGNKLLVGSLGAITG